MVTNKMKTDKSKLKWACRRGMLELDVLLNNFLDNVYFELPQEEQKKFIELLSEPDPQLYAWLMGQEAPNDPGLSAVIEKIRQNTKSNV